MAGVSKSQTLCDPAAAPQDAKTLDAECGVRSRPTTEQAALVLTRAEVSTSQLPPVTSDVALPVPTYEVEIADLHRCADPECPSDCPHQLRRQSPPPGLVILRISSLHVRMCI